MILIFAVLFVIPIVFGSLWVVTDSPLFAVLFGVSMLPWVWVWISGMWDALTGRWQAKTPNDYTP